MLQSGVYVRTQVEDFHRPECIPGGKANVRTMQRPVDSLFDNSKFFSLRKSKVCF